MRRPAARQGRRRWRPSVSAVLGVGLAFGVLLSLGLVLFLGFGAAQRNTQDLLRLVADGVVRSVRLQLEQLLESAVALDRAVAERLVSGEVAVGDGDALFALMDVSRGAAPAIQGVAFVRPDFSVVGAGRRGAEQRKLIDDWGDRPEIREMFVTAEEQGDDPWFWSAWIQDLGTGGMTAALPVRRDGELLGIVVAVVPVDRLSATFDQFDSLQGVTAFILYGRDAVLAHPALSGGARGTSAEKPFALLGELNDPVLSALWQGDAEALTDILGEESGFEGRFLQLPDGREVVALFQRLDGYGAEPIFVGAHFPLEATGGVIERLIDAAIAAGVVLLLTLAGAFLLGRSVARPIARLAEAARSVESLELERAPHLKPGFYRETAAAAEAFNGMLQGLKGFTTYVPRALVRRLMQRGPAPSEERELTVLFTDIVGFTPLAGRLSPSTVARLLNRHFALVDREIEATGGTLDKCIGDGVMAYWGAPERLPDHRRRAGEAVLAIAAALERDNDRRRRKGLRPIRLRVGVTSGPVVVGDVGAPGRINYTVVGDTVNRAQRLEQLGREHMGPEEDCIILASEEIAAALPQGLARVERLGPCRLSGHTREIEVVRLYPLAAVARAAAAEAEGG